LIDIYITEMVNYLTNLTATGIIWRRQI